MNQLDKDLNDYFDQAVLDPEVQLHWVFDERYYNYHIPEWANSTRKREKIVAEIQAYLRKNSVHKDTGPRFKAMLQLVDQIVEVWSP